MIGKRKRDTSMVSRSKAEDKQETPSAATDFSSHDVFRKFFEAQFEPLEVGPSATQDEGSEPESEGEEEQESEDDDMSDFEESDSDSRSGSGWSGFEGEEDENTPVEVIEYRAPSTKAEDLMDKRARKAFMNAKPPSFSTELKPNTNRPTKNDDNEDKSSEAQNLKNDLALQRLLKESHLLESASELAPTGKNRHKALDLRMQELGAKKSLYHQNMPSLMRRGIKAKAASKEEKRRREARENGIILEKPAPKSKTSGGRRERGVGGPSIGKFTGGTLNLSKRDISKIQKSRRGRGKTRGRR